LIQKEKIGRLAEYAAGKSEQGQTNNGKEKGVGQSLQNKKK